jgi:phosphatidylserine/phosphatidylglycerophosphate/cardiolipin synthase-like enzyme
VSGSTIARTANCSSSTAKVGFTGGVGIGTPWEGHAQDPDHWRDIHFRIEGPVVAQMQAAFNDNWIKSTGRILNGEAYFPGIEPAGPMDANVFMSFAVRRQREHAPDVPDRH